MNSAVLRVHWLKSWPVGRDGDLPYGAHHLAATAQLTHDERVFGWLQWYRRTFGSQWPSIHAPSLQTLLSWPRIRRADIVLGMFESEAHVLALLKRARIPGLRRTRLVVFVCWLAEMLQKADGRSLKKYRRLYQSVDHLICLSSNQQPLLASLLDFPPERISVVPFGIDTNAFSEDGELPQSDWLLSVGRDRGRDWPTLFTALHKTGLPCKVVCRPDEVRGLSVPPNVELLGTVPVEEYRRLVKQARAVVIATHERAYPTGQSVLLESMSAGKACIVTCTPALQDYLDRRDAVLVTPQGNPDALAEAIVQIYDDAPLRRRLGEVARGVAQNRFDQRVMWSQINDILRHVAAR